MVTTLSKACQQPLVLLMKHSSSSVKASHEYRTHLFNEELRSSEMCFKSRWIPHHQRLFRTVSTCLNSFQYGDNCGILKSLKNPCGVAGRRAARAVLGAVPAPLPAPPRGRCAGGAPRGGGRRGGRSFTRSAPRPHRPQRTRGDGLGGAFAYLSPPR